MMIVVVLNEKALCDGKYEEARTNGLEDDIHIWVLLQVFPQEHLPTIALSCCRFLILAFVTLHFLGGIGFTDHTGAQAFLRVDVMIIPKFDRFGPWVGIILLIPTSSNVPTK